MYKQISEQKTIVKNDGKMIIKQPQGSHRLEKYLNIEDYLEKSLKIKFDLKCP